jgi:hypothetical protein
MKHCLEMSPVIPVATCLRCGTSWVVKNKTDFDKFAAQDCTEEMMRRNLDALCKSISKSVAKITKYWRKILK